MAEKKVCNCGFERRAALAGHQRLLLASATVLASVAAVRGLFVPGYEVVKTATLWTLPTLTATADVAALWANCRLERCTGRLHWTASSPWHSLFLLIVLAAAAGLFAAGEPILAVSLQIYILGRFVMEISLAGDRAGLHADDESTPLDPDRTQTLVETGVRYTAFGLVTALCATAWMATGTAPAWAENTILGALWIVACALLFGISVIIWSDMVRDYLPMQHDDFDWPFMEVPQRALNDTPLVSVSRAGWWLANGGLLLLVYELSLSDHTVLATLFVLLLLMTWAVNTERRLRFPEDQRGEIGRPYLALHAATRGIARGLHLAIAAPIRAARRTLAYGQ